MALLMIRMLLLLALAAPTAVHAQSAAEFIADTVADASRCM